MQGSRGSLLVCLISWQKPESHQNLHECLCSSFLLQNCSVCRPQSKQGAAALSSDKLLSFG